MLLYKYRNLNNFDRIKDIIQNKRFYASAYTDLNDPMEGIFKYNAKYRDKYSDKLAEIKINKDNLKICSLSKTCEETLMWSHYADGERGIVIGINRDSLKRKYRDKLKPIKYKGIPFISDDEINNIQAEEILSYKKRGWRYEKEIRVFTTEDFITVEIEKVILGSRITSDNALHIKKLIDEVNKNSSQQIEIEKLENVLERA